MYFAVMPDVWASQLLYVSLICHIGEFLHCWHVSISERSTLLSNLSPLALRAPYTFSPLMQGCAIILFFCYFLWFFIFFHTGSRFYPTAIPNGTLTLHKSNNLDIILVTGSIILSKQVVILGNWEKSWKHSQITEKLKSGEKTHKSVEIIPNPFI